jgi:two-component system cell cycle sensor histidine kinase/response regulator CckA
MDEDTRKKIFEPFFSKKKTDGTGLGLSIAHDFVTRSGGFIDVQSVAGSGTSFYLYLPECAESCGPVIISPKSEELTKGAGTILVIDDESHVLSIAQEILCLSGYTVLTEHNGFDGLVTYEKNQDSIDLVLLDLSMPGITGVAVLEKMLKINPAVRVLFSSGFADDPGVAEAMSKGAPALSRNRTLRQCFPARSPECMLIRQTLSEKMT